MSAPYWVPLARESRAVAEAEAYEAHLDEQQQRAYEAHCREGEDRQAAQDG